MAKHELDNELRRYNLRAKKQRTEATAPTLEPARTNAKKNLSPQINIQVSDQKANQSLEVVAGYALS